MEDTKIALVQMKSVLNKIDLNLDKIKGYIEVAGENHVDIICFPEACINGYGKDSNPIGKRKRLELENTLKVISMEKNITILTGFIEEKENDLPYISHMINTPDGEVDYYRKSHLGESEIGYFSSGNRIPVFKSPKALIGIQICWETHFPEITSIMALNKAEIIFTPFASPLGGKRRRDIWMKYLPGRAYDNTLFIGSCNLDGALAIDPKGNLMEEDFNGNEGILYVDLQANLIDNIKDIKNNSMSSRHYISHRRPELYKGILKGYKLK